MREADVDLSCMKDARSCSVSIVPSKVRHSDAGVGLLFARTVRTGEAIGNY